MLCLSTVHYIVEVGLTDFLVPSRGGPCGAAVCAAGFRVVFAPPVLSANQKRLGDVLAVASSP
jgi:hypothetical protein